jgi:hypothetical protein
MALAAPARKLTTGAVQEPLPVEPPEPRKRPRDRPRPGGQGRSSATASVATPAPPKRKSGTTKRRKAGSGSGRKGTSGGKGPTGAKGSRAAATDSPIRRTKSSSRAAAATAAPARKAPARKAPARRKVAPRRRPAGVIPIAAGAAGTAVRGAVAVTQLPESGLIHRLTRGRAWIGLLGVLLVGIVALNVVTLSFAASAGKIDARNQELGKENSMLQNRSSTKYGTGRITNEAKKLGLSASTQANPKVLIASKGDVDTAAARLSAAAAGTTAAAAGAGESAEGEAATDAEAATGEEAVTGEEVAASSGGSGAGEEAATGETDEAAESEFTPEELEIYEAEYAELLASEGGE